jgi:AraC family transcriptional regulator, transcriptional activator of pobA
MEQILPQQYPVKEEIAPNDYLQVRNLDRKNYQATVPGNYRIIWMESGVKSVSIDFLSAECFPFTILFLTPRMVPKLKFTCTAPKGWILEFSADFFRDQYMEGFNVRNIDIYYQGSEIPMIALSPKIGERINSIAEMIAELLQSQIPYKEAATSSLLKTLLVYCDSKCNIKLKNNSNNHHLNIVTEFKHLVSKNLQQKHQVTDYAEMMNITPKYLNQVVKSVMGVTAKSLIQEQLIIQACRELKFSNDSIKEIAINLGFLEPEHFTNFFKKNLGYPPLEYRMR